MNQDPIYVLIVNYHDPRLDCYAVQINGAVIVDMFNFTAIVATFSELLEHRLRAERCVFKQLPESLVTIYQAGVNVDGQPGLDFADSLAQHDIMPVDWSLWSI